MDLVHKGSAHFVTDKVSTDYDVVTEVLAKSIFQSYLTILCEIVIVSIREKH